MRVIFVSFVYVELLHTGLILLIVQNLLLLAFCSLFVCMASLTMCLTHLTISTVSGDHIEKLKGGSWSPALLGGGT